MRFFGLVDSYFKELGGGKKVFFPYGVLGRGYLVTPEVESRIKSFLSTYYSATFGVAILCYFNHYIALAVLPFVVVYRVKMRSILAQSEKTEHRQRVQTHMENQAREMGRASILLMLLGSLFLLALSGAVLFVDPEALWTGIVAVVFAGICLFYFIVLLRLSLRG